MTSGVGDCLHNSAGLATIACAASTPCTCRPTTPRGCEGDGTPERAAESHRLCNRFGRFCFDFQANVTLGALLAPPFQRNGNRPTRGAWNDQAEKGASRAEATGPVPRRRLAAAAIRRVSWSRDRRATAATGWRHAPARTVERQRARQRQRSSGAKSQAGTQEGSDHAKARAGPRRSFHQSAHHGSIRKKAIALTPLPAQRALLPAVL